MKLIIKTAETPLNFLRKAGYGFIGQDEKTGELSFSRRLGGDNYPRFHAYSKSEKENLIINLHLDQKRTSYKGFTAHSGEYDGKLIEEESQRLKNIK